MTLSKVLLNDGLIDVEQARVSTTDTGFLYGAGLFETMRSRHGVVFHLHDHLERLRRSAAVLSITHTYNNEYLEQAISRLLAANELMDARLRLTLTNGPLLEAEEARRPTLLITATEFRPYPADYYRTGLPVPAESDRPRLRTQDDELLSPPAGPRPRPSQPGRRGDLVHDGQPRSRGLRQQRLSREEFRSLHAARRNAGPAGHRTQDRLRAGAAAVHRGG
jgi:hypothetical protein